MCLSRYDVHVVTHEQPSTVKELCKFEDSLKEEMDEQATPTISHARCLRSTFGTSTALLIDGYTAAP